MQRKDPDVKLEFVCEEHDEKNLMALAENGNVADLICYLQKMNLVKIKAFFADSKQVNQFLNKFPSKQIAENFKKEALETSELEPLMPETFKKHDSAYFRQNQTQGLFSPQPVCAQQPADLRLTRSFSPGK